MASLIFLSAATAYYAHVAIKRYRFTLSFWPNEIRFGRAFYRKTLPLWDIDYLVVCPWGEGLTQLKIRTKSSDYISDVEQDYLVLPISSSECSSLLHDFFAAHAIDLRIVDAV